MAITKLEIGLSIYSTRNKPFLGHCQWKAREQYSSYQGASGRGFNEQDLSLIKRKEKESLAWRKGNKMVKHCYSVANNSGQSLGTHRYQHSYGSGYNSHACGSGQFAAVSVALGQGVKAGGRALTVLHLPIAQCNSRHTQQFWPPPFGTLPGLPPCQAASFTLNFVPPTPAQQKSSTLCFLL